MDIYVERHGAGKPVVFIHGASGSTFSWYFQKEHLKKSMEVILLDLPGHGKSSGDGCDRLDECKEAVHEALKKASIEKCHMVGHSMGGALAMLFALTYPGLLEGLVLVSTGARLRVFPEILEGILKDKESTVRRIAGLAFSRKAPPSLVEAGFKEMMKCRQEVIYNDFYSCEQVDLMDEVKRIKLPTLILCGEDDLLTPPKYSAFLHAEIADSKFVRVPDAGHILMLEKPEAVNRAIEEFVIGKP